MFKQRLTDSDGFLHKTKITLPLHSFYFAQGNTFSCDVEQQVMGSQVRAREVSVLNSFSLVTEFNLLGYQIPCPGNFGNLNLIYVSRLYEQHVAKNASLLEKRNYGMAWMQDQN